MTSATLEKSSMLLTPPADKETFFPLFYPANPPPVPPRVFHLHASTYISWYCVQNLVHNWKQVLHTADFELLFHCHNQRKKKIYILGGFNFILFWNFNRNHTENDRYWQKNSFLLFAKCLKMYSFFRICILTLSPTALGPIGPRVFKGIQLKA